MRCLDVGTALGEGHLYTGWTPRNEVSKLPFSNSLQRFMHLGWINFALNNIQNRDIGTLLDRRRHQYVLCLKQPTHHIEHCCLPHILLLRGIKDERRVTSHQEMTTRSGDQRSDQTHQIVVHVSRVPQCRRRCTHDRRHDRVGLSERWLRELQSVGGHPRQGVVVNDYCGVGIQGQSLCCQHAVVWLDHDIIVVGEYTIGLYELLWESIVQSFEQE